MTYPEPSGDRSAAYCLTTYALFALTGWLALAVVAPQPLANLGVIGAGSLRGWSTLASIVFGPPAALSALVASVFSLGGLALGPWPLRLRIAAWWLTGAGGPALSALTAPNSRFSPSLGGDHFPLLASATRFC